MRISCFCALESVIVSNVLEDSMPPANSDVTSCERQNQKQVELVDSHTFEVELLPFQVLTLLARIERSTLSPAGSAAVQAAAARVVSATASRKLPSPHNSIDDSDHSGEAEVSEIVDVTLDRGEAFGESAAASQSGSAVSSSSDKSSRRTSARDVNQHRKRRAQQVEHNW